MSAVTTEKIQMGLFVRNVRNRISSLLKNPANGGIPAIASVPIIMVGNVTGMYRFRPPIFRMSCSPAIA